MEGWNDPLDLSKYEPTGKLKINLNKRVAFPLCPQSNEGISENTVPLKTLPTVSSSILHEEPNNNINEKKVKDSFDSEVAKQKIYKILEEGAQALNPTIEKNVRAKLKNLEDDWNNCDIDLQKLLLELAEYVKQKDAKNAGGIQRKIIMKGCNKPFMQGIRQIIFSLEAKESESNADIVSINQ